MAQTAGIRSLLGEYLNPFTDNFRGIEEFFTDVAGVKLPDYTFIEPRYDTGNNYVNGNSMHPLNDIRHGEKLVKSVYEALRNSEYWKDTMLIITFDEHGGFYDHQSPPATVATGDDSEYANPSYNFRFDRLGVRVPALFISAYTSKGTVIGGDPNDTSTVFDHTSVPATAEKLFGLKPLTKRDAAANTLDVAINSATPRLAPTECLTKLPDAAPDQAVVKAFDPSKFFAANAQAPLSTNQKTMAALALACELKIAPPNYHAALISNHQKLVEQGDAANYIQKVADTIVSRRKTARQPQ
jgi:phospholipase C